MRKISGLAEGLVRLKADLLRAKVALIAAGVALVILLIGFLGLVTVNAVLTASMSSGSDPCQQQQGASNTVLPGSGGQGFSAEQLTNARAIDQAARNVGLNSAASILGIQAALDESDLNNLNYGDRDSLGILQQRPSMGWGTPAQIMNPLHAATSFFIGPKHDRRAGLVTIPNWEKMEPTLAIAAVQRPWNDYVYAPFRQRALSVAKIIGVDVDREVKSPEWDPCAGSKFGAEIILRPGPCPLDPLAKKGRTCDDAIRFGQEQIQSRTQKYNGWCLMFVDNAYGGLSLSGHVTAYIAAQAYQARGLIKTEGAPNRIPRGAVMWWGPPADGTNPAGHVAISLGEGMILTTSNNGVKVLSWQEIAQWNQPFLGWSPAHI